MGYEDAEGVRYLFCKKSTRPPCFWIPDQVRDDTILKRGSLNASTASSEPRVSQLAAFIVATEFFLLRHPFWLRMIIAVACHCMAPALPMDGLCSTR